MDTIQGNFTGRAVAEGKSVNSVDPNELVDAVAAAKLLRQKPQTLAAWRCEGRGCAYLKIGRAVYYRRADIAAWLGEQIVRPSAT